MERCLACEADGEQGGKVRQTHAVSALYVVTWFQGSLRGATGLIHLTLKRADRLEARRTIGFAYHRPRNLSFISPASAGRRRKRGSAPRSLALRAFGADTPTLLPLLTSVQKVRLCGVAVSCPIWATAR
jgi:hypothetical protein